MIDKYYHSESDNQLIRKDSLGALCDYRLFRLGYTFSRLDNNEQYKCDDDEKEANLSLEQVDALLKHIDSYTNGPVVRSTHASKLLALDDTYNVIIKEKNMSHTPSKSLMDLKDAIHRIYTYKQIEFITSHLASIKYDSKDSLHAVRLISLWNHMMPNELIDCSSNLVSNRWSRIGKFSQHI